MLHFTYNCHNKEKQSPTVNVIGLMASKTCFHLFHHINLGGACSSLFGSWFNINTVTDNSDTVGFLPPSHPLQETYTVLSPKGHVGRCTGQTLSGSLLINYLKSASHPADAREERRINQAETKRALCPQQVVSAPQGNCTSGPTLPMTAFWHF